VYYISFVKDVPTTGVFDKWAKNLYIVKKIKRDFSYCFRDGLFDNYSNLGTLAKHLPGNCRRVITSRALGQGM
jgi:hypothetical protein